MVNVIKACPCIKKYVKKGFLDEYEVMSMFQKTVASQHIKEETISENITQLIRSLE